MCDRNEAIAMPQDDTDPTSIIERQQGEAEYETGQEIAEEALQETEDAARELADRV